ncbi:MAG: hypothetical protein L3J67_04990 [Hyphomicrobiaceae bacterium]|nr:hypothetical protein [Hyphomicrobiaceae bacterium]
MSKVSQKRENSRMRALVPVSMPRRADRGTLAQLASDSYGAHAAGGTGLSCAGSPFLTQLSCQYETKQQGRTRRAQARAVASEHYGKSRTGNGLRHLVWA